MLICVAYQEGMVKKIRPATWRRHSLSEVMARKRDYTRWELKFTACTVPGAL
jgi:hypothetical protein